MSFSMLLILSKIYLSQAIYPDGQVYYQVDCDADDVSQWTWSGNIWGPPSRNPTRNASNKPIGDPSNNPSVNPSRNPTENPSNNPTRNPSTDSITTQKPPTLSPMQFPTSSTSIPSVQPLSLTASPRTEPTTASQESAIITTLSEQTTKLNAEIIANSSDNYNIVDFIIDYIAIIIIALFVIIIIISYIDATFIRENDFFKLGTLIIASTQILDMVYDCLFVVRVNKSPHLVLLVFGISFIVMPMLVTLYQLHKEMNKWKRNEILSEWISDNITFLYIVSVICGSAFTGIQLCTSNVLNLRQFDMPLNKIERKKFESKRIFSVVLFENIPQIGIQIAYLLMSTVSTSDVVFVSMGFSVLSIIISILCANGACSIQAAPYYGGWERYDGLFVIKMGEI